MNKEKKDYWYKDIVIYQIHVRSFFDSNQDGIGDFPGLISKLDYLEYLGINAIWLLPFYPSPLKDEGYDIADYKRVNPIYGNLNDFKHLVKEAHRRNIKIITELVINHTSNEHPWFKRAQLAPKGSIWRDYYTWSDHPNRFTDARIIFKDFETSNWTWDPIAKAYYWHRFYSHQPDLNYENPKVHDEIFKIVDFWLALGVDGMRLDAIPYLYQKEGTNCENLPETHAFLKKLHHHIDKKYPDRFLLAEANQWPEEAIQYFGDGDECQMAFHFPLMPRIFMAVQMEDKYPVVDIIEQTPPIPDNCQWAIFLRNHDELTLEMVTDEERDYMYRMYGQDPQMRINLGIRRRLAPLLNGDRRKIELLNILLFSLPGSPVLYYGDEIGMGDNFYLGDRNGVRTPMQWSNDSNAGFSMANPQKLFLPVIIDPEYSYQFVNVKLQQQNAQSLLFWVKRLISVRARYKALSQGSIRFLSSTNNKILAFIREYEDTKVVVVANLSRYTQTTHIDFTEYEHYEPLEVFGQNAFPRVTQESYFLVLAPYGYLWLELQNNQISEQRLIEPPLKQVDTIESFFKQHKYIEEALREYLPSCRWFRSKNDKITQIRVLDQFEIKKSQTYLFLLNIDFAHQRPENYFVTLHASDKKPEKKPYLLKIANAHSKHYYLVEAEHSPTAMSHLFLQFRTKKIINGNQGKISIHANSYAQKIVDNKINPEDLTPLSKEQSNTSVAFNDQAILKIFRLQEEGENPEVEISTQLKNFKEHISAKIAAVIDYETEQKKSTIAIINEYISNEGTAWDLSINLLEHALEQIHFNAEDLPEKIVFPWDRLVVPPHGDEELGVYREIVKKLAQKTASMHLLLASIKEKNFTPESFTLFDQRSMYQGLNHLLNKTAKKLSTVDQRFDFNSAPFAKFCKQLLHNKLGGKKIRCHGDYHLGQILYTGMDFIIIDYEGEPVRAVSERKLKRSPLKDIAGMLRSFHYVLHKLHQEKSLDIKAMDYLYSNLCQRFMQEYLKKAHILLPDDEENIAQLLKGFMMEKTLYEIIYEIDNRPDWISIPYHGLHYLL